VSSAGYLNFTYYISNKLNAIPAFCYLYLDGSKTDETAFGAITDNADNTFYDISVSAGSHKWYVECNNTHNNRGTTAPFIITGTTPTGTGTVTVNTAAGANISVNTTQTGVDAGLDITTQLSESANITINEYSSAPAGQSAFTVAELGRYVTITSELTSMQWAIIKIYYTDAEVTAKGMDEAILRIWYYNATDGTWTKYDTPDGGVDTTNNYVWANTTHFSLWGIGGSSVVSGPVAGPPSGGCTIKWECGTWSSCQPNGTQTRICADKGTCKLNNKNEVQSCIYTAPAAACPACSPPGDWSACANNRQVRTAYRCSAATNYACEPFEESRTCEVWVLTAPWALCLIFIVLLAITAAVYFTKRGHK
jgi:hypothetical protein